MMLKEIIELREKVYDMSNGEFPLNTFFNDIRDNTSPTFNKELAYKDLKKVVERFEELEKVVEVSNRIIEKLERTLGKIKDEVECPYNQDCVSQCEDILKIINEVL